MHEYYFVSRTPFFEAEFKVGPFLPSLGVDILSSAEKSVRTFISQISL